MASDREVAAWMLERLEQESFLYQETVVYEITQKFGESFTYTNISGGQSIVKAVLKEFRALTGDSVVWDRTEKMWRKRQGYDQPGRRQG